MLQLLAVGVGGCAGAITRYVLTGWVQRRFAPFPAGTLLVNVAGCFLIGVLMTLITGRPPDQRPWLTDTVQRLLVTGFLGSLTTFSAFGYESVELLREDQFRLALWSIAANLVLGFGAVWLGRWVVRALGG